MIFFCIPGPDDQNRWNRKNCPKFFHGVIFALWIQICNPNLCKSHTFWNTANIENWTFIAYPDLMTKNRWNQKICPKFFHRIIFAFWIQICTQIYVSPIYFELQLILRNDLFLHTWTDDQNWWNRKNCPKFFHRIIFAFWIQICNPNLCKSHTFEIQQILKTGLFSHTLTWCPKIDEIEKIARNSFIQ